MPAIQIALLRGIDVGRAKRVSMANLRSFFESLGFKNVRTLLNSGNVIYEAPGSPPSTSAPRIERALLDRIGLISKITVLTAADLTSIIDDNPLRTIAHNPSRLLVTMLTNPVDRKEVQPLLKQKWTPETLALGRRAVYLWTPEGILKSKAAVAVSRIVGDGATSRNWATMLKLQALVEGMA